ncbi:universal stress protein [Rhodohalobacter sp. 614A]|uniref:universal stress protein n=1 Tax=Rhodohalobacter sp. 614A TaxID=2908649 RepID=UPI001F20C996|nr:universal stress protein [Rhodohalobacter sp. 614A]
MIKRILIALDPDEDTPIATQYAISLAERNDASVTGLAVVDTSNIYPTGIIGDPDQTHHARNLWEELTDNSRNVAGRLLEKFESSVEKSGVRYTAITQEGASYDRIIEGMKYHDLLVVGRDSHFFYNEPKQETKTLAQVVKNGVSPTLIVTHHFEEVHKVLIAFDGSRPASRSLKSFAHLSPFGKDLEIELLHISKTDNDDSESSSETILDFANDYLLEHDFKNVTQKFMAGDKISEAILKRRKEIGADLIVLGAHAVSAIKRLTFGSTTHELITKTDSPLFMTP